MNSILSPDMKGVVFISGYRGKGKTFLASHADYPENIAFFDFDEGKAEGLHNQLGFGYYKPVVENEPLKRADMFLKEIENFPQDKFTVVIIDNVLPLEKALQSVVYRDAKDWAKIYGYTVGDVMTDNFGKARGIVNDFTGDAICKPLYAKGVKLIIVTSHVKEKHKTPGKMIVQGRDRWQELSILTLILVNGDQFPVPSAIVQKEALGKIEINKEADYEAIMRGEEASHLSLRRLPDRLPVADWQAIRRYLYEPADFNNLAEGEKLSLAESEPFSDRLSKEQIAYRLASLKEDDKQEKSIIAEQLLIKQSQENEIKSYISANLNGQLGPVAMMAIKKAIESGKLVYDGEVTIGKIKEWSK